MEHQLTPVEQHGNFLVKRDDLFTIAGQSGGKARTCYYLATQPGVVGIVTAGASASPQVCIVANVAKHLGLPCRVHVPARARQGLSAESLAAEAAGATIIQHRGGYNNVIISRAKHDPHLQQGWREVPFGMECQEAVEQTRLQVANIPKSTKRIVIPVGSGMSLCGMLHGLQDVGLGHVPVLGVVVGAAPTKRLTKYAPIFWQSQLTLVNAGLPYGAPAPNTMLGALQLDPIYEAKCLPFLEPDDLLWVVGVRSTL